MKFILDLWDKHWLGILTVINIAVFYWAFTRP